MILVQADDGKKTILICFMPGECYVPVRFVPFIGNAWLGRIEMFMKEIHYNAGGTIR